MVRVVTSTPSRVVSPRGDHLGSVLVRDRPTTRSRLQWLSCEQHGVSNHRELSYTIVIIGIMLMISTAYTYGNVNTCIKFQTKLFSHDISMIDHSYWGFTASMPSWFVLEPTGHPSAGKQITSVLVLSSFLNRDHSHKKRNDFENNSTFRCPIRHSVINYLATLKSDSLMCHSCMIDAPAASMGTTASDISVISME